MKYSRFETKKEQKTPHEKYCDYQVRRAYAYKNAYANKLYKTKLNNL